MSAPETRLVRTKGGMSAPETRLVRTKGGMMVHRRGCSYASFGVPWVWAEGKSNLTLWFACDRFGYGLCKRCKPLSDGGEQA